MLKYGTPNERRTNLNFDIKSLAKASGLLLGKNKTQEYLKFKTNKELLKWLGELEAEALNVYRNKNADFPKDLDFKASKETLEDERRELATSILELRNLYNSIETSELETLIRIRSKNQFDAINKSAIENIRNKEGVTEVVVRVCQKDLPLFVREGENTGYSKLTVVIPESEEEYIKTQLKKGDVLFIYRDELTQRPESKRIAQGNKLKSILRDARAAKKSPREIANEQSELFTGNAIQLTKNGKVTDITEKKRENGYLTLEISSLLPEVREAINKDPKGEAGRGVLTDRGLKQHCSLEYGCNGRDFVSVSNLITENLNKNLTQATKEWWNKKEVTDKEIQTFLEEYYTLSVCLEEGLGSLNNLESNRTIVKNTEELVPSKTLSGTTTTEDPETSYSLDAIGQQTINMPASGGLIAGSEWLKGLKKSAIAKSTLSANAKEYSAFLEKSFSINDSSRKIALIQDNFYRLPGDKEQEKSLDGGPTEVMLVAHQLSNELIEKYEETKEKQENEIFDSKAGELKDYESVKRVVIDDKEIGATRTITSPAKKKEILDKAEFIRRQKRIALSLPYRGEILRRLARYPYRASGLDFDRTAAEKFDNEISLSPKPRRGAPKMSDGSMIKLEDCLSPEGLEDLKIRGNQEEYTPEIARIRDLLESWQTNKLITPSSKNPIDRNIYRWLIAISTNQINEKANSLDELSKVLNVIVSNGGRVPYESDRSVERFATPLRSSPIPLMLLCGVGFDRLAKIKNGEVDLKVEGSDIEDPAKAFDLIIRWTNAENLHRMPLKETEELFIKELEEIVKSEVEAPEKKEQLIIEHASSVELSELPDFKSSYLDSIGTNGGLSEVNEENSQYKDLILPFSSSPLMMNLGGEETPIEDLKDLLKKEGIDIDLSEAELEKINMAPDVTLENWRQSVQKSINKLDEFFAAKQKDVELDIFLTEAKIEDSEDDPFLKAISELHEVLPQSADDLKTITTNLLAYSPQKITLNTQDGQIVLLKGTDSTWTTKKSGEIAAKAVELVNKAQELATSKELGPEDEILLTECQKEAEKVMLFENIEKLSPAIASLPKSVETKAGIRELKEPLLILTKQLEKAKSASNYGIKILDGIEEDSSNPDNPWGHGQAILSPKGAIEFICKKIAGEDAVQYDTEGNKIPEEKTSTYFSRQLINEESKEQAAMLLKSSGVKAASMYLKEEINKNKEAIIEQASRSLPEMVHDIKESLTSLVEHSHTEMAKQAIGEESPISRIISDKFKGRILEKKINDAIEQVRSSSKDKDKRSVIDKLVSSRALRNKVTIKSEGTSLVTDKLWAKSWLSSPRGRERVSKRFNTAHWVDQVSATANPRTAIAFLEFCHHRNIPSVAAAISKGGLSKENMETIEKSLSSFKKALDSMGIDTNSASLKTQLVGALSLHSLVNGKRPSRTWDKDQEIDLQRVAPKEEIKLVPQEISFEPILEGSKKIDSPYLRAVSERGGTDPEADLENANPKTKLRTVKRAISALYQAVPLDMHKVPSKQKTKVREEVNI
jgi:hypothetical protein